MDPELLAISFYYPPANNPRAVQVARLLRHTRLPTSLICAAYVDNSDRRDDLLVAESEHFLQNIYRVPFSISSFRRRVNSIVTKVAHPFWDEWPDIHRSWKNEVVSFVSALSLHEVSKPMAMVTFGSPMSDHLIGLDLKRRYNLRWMAHFSDPWVDNPFKTYTWLTERANLILERHVVEAADLLLFTSEETIDLVMAKYSKAVRDKCRVLTHSYEAAKYRIRRNDQSDITIRFLGELYGPRTPQPLFAALNSINKDDPEFLKGIRIEFVGSICDLNIWEMGLKELPADLVVLRETVPNSESLDLMSSSDGLVVIDAPAEKSPFLPSKLIDYIGAGKPVLGITPPGTASCAITDLGGWVGDPSDQLQVKNSVKEFVVGLRERRRDGNSVWGDEAVRLRYEAESVGRRFRDMVIKLVHSSESVRSMST